MSVTNEEEVEETNLISRLANESIRAIDVYNRRQEYLLLLGPPFQTDSVDATPRPETIRKEVRSDAYHIKVHEDGFIGNGGFGAVYAVTRSHGSASGGENVICLKHELDARVESLAQESEIFNLLESDTDTNYCDSIIKRLFYCTSGRDHFLGLEFFDGRPLHDVIWHCMPREDQQALIILTDRDLKNILTQQTQALKYLQDRNVLHGDIKPGNILYNWSKKNTKLIDFGLALNLRSANETITAAGETEIEYMAPELLMADGKIRREHLELGADTYSLGAVLYHLILLETPWHFTECIKAIQSVEIDYNKPRNVWIELLNHTNQIKKNVIYNKIRKFRPRPVGRRTAELPLQVELFNRATCNSEICDIVINMLTIQNEDWTSRIDCAEILRRIAEVILPDDVSTARRLNLAGAVLGAEALHNSASRVTPSVSFVSSQTALDADEEEPLY